MANGEKTKAIKLWSSILTVTFALIGGIFAGLGYLDDVYASDADVISQIAPIQAKIDTIMVSQNSFTSEIRELRKDRIRDQIRAIKKEKYSVERMMAQETASVSDIKHLQDLEFDLQDLQSRLESIE